VKAAPDERTLLFKLFDILRTCDWQVGSRGVFMAGRGSGDYAVSAGCRT
jgi:hypothetical protein